TAYIIDPPSRRRSPLVRTVNVDQTQPPQTVSPPPGNNAQRPPRRGAMARLASRAWAVACYLSLAICCAAAIFWARSAISGEGIVARRGFSSYWVTSADSVLIFIQQRTVFDSPQAEQQWKSIVDPVGDYNWSQWRF